MTNIQPYKAAIVADLTNGDFEAATNRALSLYPSKRAALERASLTKDVDLFRELCGLDVEFEQPRYTIQTAPVSYQSTAPDYAPLIKGVAVLGGVAVFGTVVLKVCAVILTGAMVGLSAAVATVTEYGAYIGGIIIAVWGLGFLLFGRNDEGPTVAKKNTNDGINVVVNIHSNNNTNAAQPTK
jgi:hypothetical protein